MKTVQLKKKDGENWDYLSPKLELKTPLVLVFGNRFMLESKTIYQEIHCLFPDGHIVFGSSSGDITSNSVSDNTITITAVEFEKADFQVKTFNILSSGLTSYEAGEELIKQFPKDNLKFIFVVSVGSNVNGSQLTQGMNSIAPDNVLITGGLCGDGDRFEKTIASYNENPKEGELVAIGFYGDSFEASFSIRGGWTPFGPERIVTKSHDNILYELDAKPALDLYKKYLGDKSSELPSAALVYPLNVKSENEKQSFVRTILNIDEQNNSMILAGDIPMNSKVQLMMTHVDEIVTASELAAKQALEPRTSNPQLALLVSCIGRKLVLDQRVEEEIEEIIEVVGNHITVGGFYSYGEIAPFQNEMNCQLHNQTMTITLISE